MAGSTFAGLLASLVSVLLAIVDYAGLQLHLLDTFRKSTGPFAIKIQCNASGTIRMYEPIKSESNVIVVFIHGGGWHSGTNGDEFWVGSAFIGEELAKRGVRTALLTYPRSAIPMPARFAIFGVLIAVTVALAALLSFVCLTFGGWLAIGVPVCAFFSWLIYVREISTSGDYEASIADQFSSIVHSLGELNLMDPEARLVVAGHSAGGHLALLTATKLPHWSELNIACVISISGVADVGRLYTEVGWFLQPFVRYYCLEPTFKGHDPAEWSPHQLLLRQEQGTRLPLMILVNARADNPELVEQADRLFMLLANRNTKPEPLRIPNVGFGHGLGLIRSESLMELLTSTALRFDRARF